MKKFFVLNAVIMAVFFISGCTSAKQLQQTKADLAEDGYHSSGRYYYYLQSLVQQKKGNLDQAIDFLKKAIEIDPGTNFLKNELVGLYLQQKDYPKALEVVKGILSADPQNVDALLIYGRIEQTLKHTEEAKKAYQKILAINPKLQNVYLFLGSIFMDENDLPGAHRVYQKLVEAFPDSYVGYFFLGQIDAAQGNRDVAEKEFRKTLELRPDLEGPKFELIDLYKASGKTKDVIDLYKEILKEDPQQVRATMELGYYFYQIGNLEESDTLLRRLGASSSENPEVIRTFAQVYLDPKKYDAALVVIKGMLRGGADNSDLQYAAGIAYDGKEDNGKALEHFLMVKPDSKFYENAAVHIAYLYLDMKKFDEGIRYLRAAIARQPGDADLWMYLASFYEETEDYAQSEEALQQGLKIDPNSGKLYFRLGVVYDKWNRKDDGIAAMKQAIKLDPQNANALNYLGYTYADLGQNLDEAEKLVIEALKYKPDDGYITDSLGWVYYKKGMIKEAVKYLEKAVSLVPDDPTILEHLGDAYVKANEKEKALDSYQRSLTLRKKDKVDIEAKIRQLTGDKGP